MLLNFNALSAARYENAAVDFRRHSALLLDMKRELDNVFRSERGLLKTVYDLCEPPLFKTYNGGEKKNNTNAKNALYF